MSNASYVACLNCDRLMQGGDDNLSCPDCNANVCITDGSEYADCGYLRDDERHGKDKCDCEFDEDDE